MPSINHLICLSVKDLALIPHLIAHDLQVFEAGFLEITCKNTITIQWVILKADRRNSLGKLIISIVLFALACAPYALC